MSWCGVCEQGDSPDSMLQWVLSQSGQKVIKDPDLVKQVALAVLRQAIPHPKVSPCPLPPCLPVMQSTAVVWAASSMYHLHF